MCDWAVDFLEIAIRLLPSSIVLTTTTGLFGPSPSEVKASNWNSYPVYFFSPVTSLVLIAPLLIGSIFGDSAEPVIL